MRGAGLTPKQCDLLRFIRAHMVAHDGVTPSYDDMALALGIKSRSGIHRMLGLLKQRGYIERRKFANRSIRILAMPEDPPHPPVSAQDLLDLVARLNAQEGPEVTIAALADASARVAALFRATEGNA